MTVKSGRPLPCRETYSVMVILMAYCGLRIGEVIALRAGSVDLDGLRLHVVESLNEVAGGMPVVGAPKYGIARSLPIPIEILPRLSSLMEELGEQELVFTGLRGQMLQRGNWANRIWKPATVRVGLGEDITPYTLRHSFASFAVASGCSVEELQSLMGFASIANTRATYRDLFPKGRARKYCSDRCMRNACRDTKNKVCDREGCDRFVRAKGLCTTHYNATYHQGSQRKYDDPEDRRRRLRLRTQWRRARQADPDAETIDRDLVGDRDGWMCGICRCDVDNALSWPDPMSPSLDHIVPLSRGGRHTYSNVRITHLTCNVKRGARIEV